LRIRSGFEPPVMTPMNDAAPIPGLSRVPGPVPAAIKIVAKRLVAATLAGRSDVDLLAAVCDDLMAEGVPLQRAAVGAQYLHPTVEVRMVRWRRGRGAEAEAFDREPEGAPEDEDWLTSPFYRLLHGGGRTLRLRLDDGAIAEFPMLAQFRAEGGTDYVAFRQPVGEGVAYGELRDVFISFLTDREGGFTDTDLQLLGALHPLIVLALGSVLNVGIGRTLLETYLGRDAAGRVLAGNIVRGRAETVRAVIWYSDLHGFTRLTDTLPNSDILRLLNDYAEPIVDAIEGEGGEVLKFMGDGILAIFGGREPPDACAAAIRAWEQACKATQAISRARKEQGRAVTEPYLALHEGEVLYGNFGGRARLDFTVLGPAVNEAARIAAMCRSLDQAMIMSDAFASASDGAADRMAGLGRYMLRGVGKPQMLWTLDETRAE
jgi:adenylate cyclase